MIHCEEQVQRISEIIDAIDIASLPSVLECMKSFVQCKLTDDLLMATEDAHIAADLLMARLLLEASDHVASAESKGMLQQIVATYRKGVGDEWWHA